MQSILKWLCAPALLTLIVAWPVNIASANRAIVSHSHETPPAPGPRTPLDPVTQPKFVNRLPIPETLHAGDESDDEIHIRMQQVRQDLGLVDPKTGKHLKTTLWGYNGVYPGPTIEARVNETLKVDWINNLPEQHLFPIDHSVHGAMGVPDVRTVVHVHGAVTGAESDGYPEFWWTSDPHAKPNGMGGPAGNHIVYTYPNEQEAATLWYHDHALGITRDNVYAGLAGFFLVRDPEREKRLNLPHGKYDIPLLIQDRDFNSDGSLSYPAENTDFNIVNGKAWPYLKVEPRKYRFRILNGANLRWYNLHLSSGQPFTVIANDRGYLNHPARMDTLLVGNAERFDVILDFSGMAPGTKITMTNDSRVPFPDGTAPNPATSGLVMQFVVGKAHGSDDSEVPETLNQDMPESIDHAFIRRVTLNEFDNPFIVFLNNLGWDEPITEVPRLNTTEIWDIINPTSDAHPIHIHLIQFEVLNRQKFDTDAYTAAYNKVNAGIPQGKGGTVISPDPYLQDGPLPPDPSEMGPKDTVKAMKGMVTRVVVRFPDYHSFDPTQGNYVWHCHILEHEDNDMMRPYRLIR